MAGAAYGWVEVARKVFSILGLRSLLAKALELALWFRRELYLELIHRASWRAEFGLTCEDGFQVS